MTSGDNQQIFEQYIEIVNEVGLPGGQRYSIGSRLGAWAGKKFTGGLLGKGAMSKVNVEKDANHFLRKIKDDARHASVELRDIFRNEQQANRWFGANLGINNLRAAPELSKLVDAAKSGKNRDIYNLVHAAVLYRNKMSAFGSAPQQPRSTGIESQPANFVAAEPDTQSTTPSQPAPPAAVAIPPTSPPPAAKKPSLKQSKVAVDDAVKAIGSVRARDRMKAVKYAQDKIAAIADAQKSSTPSNVLPMQAAAESTVIRVDVITEEFSFIDCRKF